MAKNWPFVSVIIPTLNEEKYVEQTLKAVKIQDYPGKFEIIVSDGKSKDNTVKIAKKYADKVLICKKKGIAYERNFGAKNSKGEILIFVDADTILLPNTIKELVKPLLKKKCVGSTCPIIPNKFSFIDIFLFSFWNSFIKLSLKTRKPQVAGACCAYKREAFFKIGGFDEKKRILEDYDLSERIAKYGKIKFVESTFAITSVRRFEKWGRLKASFIYPSLYLSYLFMGKPIKDKIYKPVR